MDKLDCPLSYFWITLQTQKGGSVSYLETHFDSVTLEKGSYLGTCAVVGISSFYSRDRIILHNRLQRNIQRHRGLGRGFKIELKISDCGYDYRTESGLRALISRGSKGTLFEYGQRIGKVLWPTTAWLQKIPALD